MKIKVDRENCRGHAQCNARAPEVFDLDDDGYVLHDEIEVPPGQEAQALDGLRACPEGAIMLGD